MKTEILNFSVSATFDNECRNRYSLLWEWDSTKKKALIIMKQPSSSTINELDMTTMLCLNNLCKLDYGSMCITNLSSEYSKSDNYNNSINFAEIAKYAKEFDTVILAYGSCVENNANISKLEAELHNILHPISKEKTFYIANPKDTLKGMHPLSPCVRSNWNLLPYEYKLKGGFNEVVAKVLNNADKVPKTKQKTKL